MENAIAPGAHIELRDAVWRVTRIDQTSSGGQAWRCVGVSELVKDHEAIFLEEFEHKSVKVLDPKKTRLKFDDSQRHRRGLLYMESLLRDVPPVTDAICVGHRAAMDALDFQLEPSRLALAQPRARILIADAVGLGKTLEAGILLSELIRRGKAKRILVAATKAMLTQFQKEMWSRFSIPLVRLDSVGLARVRAEIPTNHNPFYFFDRSIVSIDTLKQNNWFQHHVEQARWDVIVIDEAHNVATRGTDRSQRAHIANVLANNCDHLLLLSATPHDGKPESFASLMNMLDPTAITDPSNYTKDEIEGLFVRRFKKDVREQLSGHIQPRKTSRAAEPASGAEEHAYDVLTKLKLDRIDGKRSGGMLFKTTLTKALFSSPRACVQTVETRIANLQRDPQKAKSFSGEIEELEGLKDAVDAITVEDFSRYQRLLKVIKGDLKWKGKNTSDRLVIFTERVETMNFLAEHLKRELKLKDAQVETLSGSMSDVQQGQIVEAFGQDKAKVRLLIATDVASEGLNLHYLAYRMIHFDLPWSLMVFQQRNGRIDRYGQEKQPHIVYLQTEAKHPTIRGDQRILELLMKKSDAAESNIGDPSLLMHVCDIDQEQLQTARAIEEQISPEDFDAQLDEEDPFAALLSEGADSTVSGARRQDLASLFGSDFDFMEMAIEQLRADSKLKATVRREDQIIELTVPRDLKRRLKKFPREVRPKDGVLLLTADPQRMQRALSEARRAEDSWPTHQYLWPNNPVLTWARDRMRGTFGRHTAPVLVVPSVVGKGNTVMVVSGNVANRRGQALVHRWFAVHLKADKVERVESFEEFVERVELGRKDVPNLGNAPDLERLETLVAPAIEAVERELLAAKRAFEEENQPKLDKEQARLRDLEARRLAFIDGRVAKKKGPQAKEAKARDTRAAKNVFQRYQHWVADSMTAGPDPFFELIAVLHGGDK